MLWINGKYVLRGPARFNPKGPEYDTDDMTSYLQRGDNEIVVLVMADQSNGKMMHHEPGLTVRLDMGSQTVLTTDETWKWSDQTRYRDPHVDWGK
jgi:alpha-L-rhamnosidase